MKLIPGFIRRFFARSPAKAGKRVRGSYDAAQTTDENANHWAWTDALNANAANSPEVRKVLRERARYEADNDCHTRGLVDKLACDLVGTGPRLQLTIPNVTRQAARQIERAFAAWSRATGYAAKLRTLAAAKTVDGESFGLLTTNPALPRDGVQLDLRLYETDQVHTPWFLWTDRLAFDGGRLDEFGNVAEWHLMQTHPGSNVWTRNYLHYDKIPAASMVHWFQPRRPGQVRGVSELTAALPLVAYRRRYTLATVAAAETAANLAGVLETDAPMPTGPNGEPQAIAIMDQVPLARGMLVTTPANCKALQFKPEQPTTSHKEFSNELAAQTGMPVGAPRNVAIGSSAEYNFSSAKMDERIYVRMIRVQRSDLRCRVLDPVFRAWLDEAVLVPGLIPDGLPPFAAWSWEWHWDGFDSIDPEKDEKRNDLALRNNTTTLAAIYAEQGLDWEEQLEQRAREQEKLNHHGLSAAAAAMTPAAPSGGDGEEDHATATQAAASGGVQGTALNGAQIASLLMIADGVKAGRYSPDEGQALAQASFPLMSLALIKRFCTAPAKDAPTPNQEAADADEAKAAAAV